jgi:hypothetical protein
VPVGGSGNVLLPGTLAVRLLDVAPPLPAPSPNVSKTTSIQGQLTNAFKHALRAACAQSTYLQLAWMIHAAV